MSRINFISKCAICSTAILTLSYAATAQERDFVLEAKELHKKIINLDTHSDTPMLLWRDSYKIASDNDFACIDFPKMRKGGLDMATFAIFTPQGELTSKATDEAYEKALATFDKIIEAVAQNSDSVIIVSSPSDIRKGEAAGKLMILPSVENSYPMGKDLSRFDYLYKKGIRMFGLCHSYLNEICDSSTDKAKYNGLSDYGKEVVAKLNEINAIIDVSHASDQSTLQTLKLSKDPIIASHSSAQAIASHARNLNDELLDAFKENGGVIQLCFLDAYTKDMPKNEAYSAERRALYQKMRATKDSEEIAAIRKEIAGLIEKYPDQKVYVKDFVDHIDHIVKRIGIEHVGIGSDFDGGGGVYDCSNAAQFPNITAELLRRGYSESDLKKIWGENFLRVFTQVLK